MSYIEIDFTKVSTPNDSFENITSLLTSSDNYASRPGSGVDPGQLTIYDTYASLPHDINITGVEYLVTAMASGTGYASAVLVGQPLVATTGTSYTAVGTAQSTSVMTSSFASYTIGGSANLFNYDLRRYEVSGLGKYFGLSLSTSGASTVSWAIKRITARVYYTTSANLVGSRSIFKGGSSTFKDVPNNNLKPVTNNPGLVGLIRSYDCNLLGDALFNIERYLLSLDSKVVSTNKTQKSLFVGTVTITGTISGAPSSVIYYKAYTPANASGVSNISNTGEINTSSISRPLKIKTQSCNAWITSGSTITPLLVSNSELYLSYSSELYYKIQFSCLANELLGGTAAISSVYYEGVSITPASIPSGTITVKFSFVAEADA